MIICRASLTTEAPTTSPTHIQTNVNKASLAIAVSCNNNQCFYLSTDWRSVNT